MRLEACALLGPSSSRTPLDTGSSMGSSQKSEGGDPHMASAQEEMAEMPDMGVDM